MDTHFWFRLHSFTGIVTGLMLFLICWTGTFAVLSYELDWLATPELRIEPAPKAEANWPAIIDTIQADSPSTLYVTAAPYGGPISAMLKTDDSGYVQRLFHPQTAAVIDDISAFDIQRFFRDLHRRIFYPNPWGLYLVCFFALTLLTSLIAALYFYKRWWRRFFQFRAHNLRAFLSATHKLAGLWSIWFILIISLTSLWYLFESVRYQFADGIISHAGYTETALVTLPKLERAQPVSPVSGKAIRAKIAEAFPELQMQSFRPAYGGYFYADGQAGNILLRDGANEIWLDPDSLDVAFLQRSDQLPAYWLWSDMADPLHFGDFGGPYSKAIWFIFGLLLSWIILTGTYLHAKRLQKARKQPQKYRWKLAHVATGLTILIWIGAMPVAVTRVSTFTAAGQTGGSALEPGVATFIYGWMALTIMIVMLWHYLLTHSDNKP